MKRTLLATLMLAAGASAPAMSAQCDGDLFTMNAGRGAVGVLVDVDEGAARAGGSYFTNAVLRAELNSRALFAASAMAYDSSTDRIYYASTPTPQSYHIAATNNGDFTAEEFQALGLHAKGLKPFRLAYYDVQLGTHHDVGTTRFEIKRMAFDPDTNTLYGSDRARLFTIDASSGTQSQIGLLDASLRIAGFTNWGDFIFSDGDLLFVTNTRAFSIDTGDASSQLEFFHKVDLVTAATLDQNGEILVASKNHNVSGSPNTTNLWLLDPPAMPGDFAAEAYGGLVPMRVDAMSMTDSGTNDCYPPQFVD
ncbi:hypothetical protein LRP49_03355 [Enterovibrio sp. ZSDZ35]|uniref:Uncharacterized protein n=1 Tax=Enterovibrio qingdaonensis TaxID=2899818 RepID=A0ABT5QGX4_9GAMM|nr:hypothetical protein [Enterovibrio sp. ZSDZ35]MDD1780230.1 hypothetical protein [Enterovibrio sp. ZSDZ35]